MINRSIGFTGTQEGMTALQKQGVLNILSTLRGAQYEYFHHGDCIGADEEAHKIAQGLGYKIIIHPPLNQSKRAFCEGADTILRPKEYLDRNEDIVCSSNVLIATPKEMEEVLRSGTWSTVRRGKKYGRIVHLLKPFDK